MDLANAYGSVPHKLIETVLEHDHIPEKITTIVKEYLERIHLRFRMGGYVTSWQRLEKGIVKGCTISVVLFVMAMNLLIEAGRRETRGPKTKEDIRQPPSRGYMDDLTITITTHVQAKCVQEAMEETATWARMKFEPSKSRCLVVKKGKITQRFRLKIPGEEIPSIIDNPIKCLGKWYDDTLKDVNNSRRDTTEKLINIDKTGLHGKLKAWIFQNDQKQKVREAGAYIQSGDK